MKAYLSRYKSPLPWLEDCSFCDKELANITNLMLETGQTLFLCDDCAEMLLVTLMLPKSYKVVKELTPNYNLLKYLLESTDKWTTLELL